MNGTVLQREAAIRDLKEIFAYISQHNEGAADRFLEAVDLTFQQLLNNPGMGAPRDYGNPSLTGMRMRLVRGFEKYLVFYFPRDYGLEIVRVLHSARDIQTLFQSSD